MPSYEDDEPYERPSRNDGPGSVGGRFTLILGVLLLLAYMLSGVKLVEYLPGM